MTPVAAVAWSIGTGELTLPSAGPLARIDGLDLAGVCALLAAGEMAVDKFPGIPSRTSLLPLAGRIGWAAAAGSVLSMARGGAAAPAAVMAALAAGISAFVMYRLRRGMTHGAGLPDPLVALLEDLMAIRLARSAVRA